MNTLLEMAQSHPEISVTVRLADLRDAAYELADKIRRDADEQHRRREKAAGCKLVDLDTVKTGLDVSTTTLWRWQKTGYLVPVKLGGRVYYRQRDLDALLQDHEIK